MRSSGTAPSIARAWGGFQKSGLFVKIQPCRTQIASGSLAVMPA